MGKEPFLKLLFDANIEARMGTYMQEFSLGDLEVKVDMVTLLEPMLHRHAPPMPVMLVTGDGGIQTDLVYFDILRTFVLSVDLEYSITRKDIISSTGGGHSMISGSSARSLGSADKFVGAFSDDTSDPTVYSLTDNAGSKFAEDIGRGFT
ncbi:hypothetical protein PInf_021650 [Phytophthora infestans]|nr:hypothetical protein PInf_021650 [Phytophthora infestans]